MDVSVTVLQDVPGLVHQELHWFTCSLSLRLHQTYFFLNPIDFLIFFRLSCLDRHILAPFHQRPVFLSMLQHHCRRWQRPNLEVETVIWVRIESKVSWHWCGGGCSRAPRSVGLWDCVRLKGDPAQGRETQQLPLTAGAQRWHHAKFPGLRSVHKHLHIFIQSQRIYTYTT